MRDKLTLIKIDSDIVSDAYKLSLLRDVLSKKEDKYIIIHDCKSIIRTMMNELNIPDSNSDIKTSLHNGYISNKIIKEFSSSINCIGLCGIDNNLIIGDSGAIESINEKFLLGIIEDDIIPIISPVLCDRYSQISIVNGNDMLIKISEALNIYYDITIKYCVDRYDSICGQTIDISTDNYKHQILYRQINQL